MTTDMERELREPVPRQGRRGAGPTLGTSGAAPQHVLRRGRRRQVEPSWAPSWCAPCSPSGPFAGLRSLNRSDHGPLRAGHEYEVFERTATIEVFTVTSVLRTGSLSLNELEPLSMQSRSRSAGTSGARPPAPGTRTRSVRNMPTTQTTSPLPLPYGLPSSQFSSPTSTWSSCSSHAGMGFRRELRFSTWPSTTRRAIELQPLIRRWDRGRASRPRQRAPADGLLRQDPW